MALAIAETPEELMRLEGRRRELEELTEREAKEWRRVDALIQEKQRSAYQKAARRLQKLQELARYQGVSRTDGVDSRAIQPALGAQRHS